MVLWLVVSTVIYLCYFIFNSSWDTDDLELNIRHIFMDLETDTQSRSHHLGASIYNT
jgi:hypothetical protein